MIIWKTEGTRSEQEGKDLHGCLPMRASGSTKRGGRVQKAVRAAAGRWKIFVNMKAVPSTMQTQ